MCRLHMGNIFKSPGGTNLTSRCVGVFLGVQKKMRQGSFKLDYLLERACILRVLHVLVRYYY